MRASIRPAIIGLILRYQRYVSPYKGFRCAHALCYGRGSCSDWIKRVVETRPPRLWLALSLRRFRACDAAFAVLRQRDGGSMPRRQQGFCCVIPVRCDLGLVRSRK